MLQDLGDVSVRSLSENRQASLPLSTPDLVDQYRRAAMESAHSACAHDDLVAVASRALATVARETRIAKKERMAFAVLDHSHDVSHLITVLNATLKSAGACCLELSLCPCPYACCCANVCPGVCS